MTYLVHDTRTDDFTGPFPSQCQAMSYAEEMGAMLTKSERLGRFVVRRLYVPNFMPAQIHGA
jgi:hypothetical protein